MPYDFAVTGTDDTVDRLLHEPTDLLLHRLDCPHVIRQARKSKFIGQLYGCEVIPDIERCSCLENVEVAHSVVE